MSGALTSRKAHSRNPVGENHLDTNSHMLPCSHVVARPHCTMALGSGEERTSENKGALSRGGARFNCLRGDIVLEGPMKSGDAVGAERVRE
jgi:hypothetical protein